MPDTVICDTSPLFYLHRAKCLNLLEKLYHEVTVPRAVADELKEGGKHGVDVPDVREFGWMKIKKVGVPAQIKLIPDLGKGESEVLALGLTQNNHKLILDDKLAREIAKLQKLNFTGTAGVLLRSKTEGYIDDVSVILKRLIENGFFLKDELQLKILKLAGEA